MEGYGLVIPPKFGVLTVAVGNVGGLKWVIDGPENCRFATIQILNGMLRDYEALKSTTHELLLKDLESQMLTT